MRETLTVEEYVEELVALVHPDARIEHVGVAEAVGRILASDVTTPVMIPLFDNSAMDGFAVRLVDVADIPARLLVVGEVPAGSSADPQAGPGECVRIMTGAPLPTFADAVVPVEHTTADGAYTVIGHAPAGVGAHVRRAGNDLSPGDLIASHGSRVRPGSVGALAAVGLTTVPVRPRPRIALCATGDELVRSGPLGRGQIYESNSLAVAAALEASGATVTRADVLGDRPEDLITWLDRASADADVIVLTGGASVGDYDVARDVLLQHASGVFRHVRIQPGKPQGRATWAGVPVVSMPGNPVSAVVSALVFVEPMLDRILGRPPVRLLTAQAGAGWTSPEGRRQYVPVVIDTDSDSVLKATPSHRGGSGSHLVSSLGAADALAIVGEDIAEVRRGDALRIRPL